MNVLTQTAPYPVELAQLVDTCSYRAHEGWHVGLYDDYPRDKDTDGTVLGRGMTLVIATEGYDSYHPERGRTYGVNHFFIVPAASWNREEWCRWLFEQFVLVETHEAAEHFTIDGDRPFAPLHGPGMNPYVVHQYMTNLQKRTRPDGRIVEA